MFIGAKEPTPKFGNDTVSVSDEQLSKARDLENTSQFYHHTRKGCVMRDKIRYVQIKGTSKIREVKMQECLVHECDCCRCGWQYRHHYDTPSLMLR
jgi:hypothetical protein